MLISFIIPAYNEERNIERCLLSVRSQMQSIDMPYEVIVIDNESTDQTRQLAAQSQARVLTAARGISVGDVRNFGVNNSTGNILVFLDADTELGPGWSEHFSQVLKRLEVNPRQFTGSFCVPPSVDNYFIENWFKVLPKKTPAYLGTAHLITTSAFFHELGGFKSGLVSGEDYDICRRGQAVGGALHIVEEMIVFHHDYPMKCRHFIARERWHGAGDLQSWLAFLGSKVSLASVAFIVLHLGILGGFFWGLAFAGASILMLTLMLSLLAFLKLRDIFLALKALPIIYLYYVGRSLALLDKFRD